MIATAIATAAATINLVLQSKQPKRRNNKDDANIYTCLRFEPSNDIEL